jgi:hypothetical protein
VRDVFFFYKQVIFFEFFTDDCGIVTQMVFYRREKLCGACEIVIHHPSLDE